MSIFVKICGVTDREAAEACVANGVDAVGFVFAESARQVTPEHASEIAAAVPDHILKVAVFRKPSPDDVAGVLAGFDADLVQLDEDTRASAGDSPVLPVYREGRAAPSRGRFLYEGPVSGSGREVGLDRAAEVARVGEMILAGGLRPDNVGRAILAVRPFGVDVSTGVEDAPGVKSPTLIRSFVAAVRAAEERLVIA